MGLVFSWIQKDYVAAAVLLTLYVVTMVVREVLEPKLMGKKGVKAALRAFVRVCGSEIVRRRRDRAWSNRAYDIKNGI